VILADNDDAGRKHAQIVARSLRGVAASIKVVDLPGLPAKGDVSDYLDTGHDADDLRAAIDAAPVSQSKIRLLTPTELLNKPPQESLIEGVLYKRTFIDLLGAEDSFKSFTAVHMALCIATGLPFLGHAVAKGPVVYIVGEGADGFKRRVLAWSKAHDAELPNQFRTVDVPIELVSDASIADVLDAVAQDMPAPPVLIIVDTLSANFGDGQENSNDDMAHVVAAGRKITREIGAAFMVVHHPKDGTRKPRGGTALPGGEDTRIFVERHGDAAKLYSLKSKDAPQFKLITIKTRVIDLSEYAVEVVGDVRSSLIIEMAAPDPAADPFKEAVTDLGQTARIVLDALRSFGTDGAGAAKWQKACAAVGVPHRSFYDHRGPLLVGGAVIQQGKRYVAVEVGAGAK